MAGGKGTRANCPRKHIQKVLLRDTEGKSLLEYILDQHRLYSLDKRMNLLTGFLHDAVENEIKRYEVKYGSQNVFLKYNRDHQKGILDSLYKGMKDIDDSVVILNGDTFYPKKTLEVLDGLDNSTLLVLPKSKDYYDSVRVLANKDNIVRIGKDMAEFTHVSVGALFLQRDHVSTVKELLKEISQDESYRPKIWHNLINELINRGGEVSLKEVKKEGHFEIDTEEDYDSFLKIRREK